MSLSSLWTSFHVACIFPLVYEGYWSDCGFSDLSTVLLATDSEGTVKFPQNGILLKASAHACYAAYDVSISLDVSNSRFSSLCS